MTGKFAERSNARIRNEIRDMWIANMIDIVKGNENCPCDGTVPRMCMKHFDERTFQTMELRYGHMVYIPEASKPNV